MRTSYMMTILIVIIIVTASGYYWTTIQTPETVQIQQKGSEHFAGSRPELGSGSPYDNIGAQSISYLLETFK